MTQGGLAAISELTELEKERKMEKGYIRYDYDPEHENKEVGELKNILNLKNKNITSRTLELEI